jgi:hypothetical protein
MMDSYAIQNRLVSSLNTMQVCGGGQHFCKCSKAWGASPPLTPNGGSAPKPPPLRILNCS